MVSTCLLLIAILTTQIYFTSSEIQYPTLRRDESVVEDYYGVKVADPYRYLEDPDSEETRNFVKVQNELTASYLGNGDVKQKIEKEFLEMFNYPKFGVPCKHGDKYYLTKNTGLQNQSVFYVQDSLDAESKVFLDPNTMTKNGTVSLRGVGFSDDGKLAVMTWSSKGSDWMTMQIQNVTSGVYFPEVLEDIKFSLVAFTTVESGMFYARYHKSMEGDGTETKGYGSQKIYYHRVGTPQDEDVMVVEFDDSRLVLGMFYVTEDEKNLLVFPFYGKGENTLFFTSIEAPITGKLETIPIVSEMKNEYHYVTSEDSVIYLITNHNAPNNRLIAVDLNHPEESQWKTLIPEHSKNNLVWAHNVANDKLVVGYLVDVKYVMELRNLSDGSVIQKISAPLGTIMGTCGDKKDTEFFFRMNSFFLPSVIFRLDLSRTSQEGIYETKVFNEVKVAGVDPQNFVEKQVFYESKDGTQIPMFILHKKEFRFDCSAPAIINGYGGFGMNSMPYFQPDTIVFLKHFNGVYAIPSIRGGGEYGKRWHEGGRKLNKQNCFDDFHAAAEFLIREGYTNSSKIAISGASNGGLLVAACANQRPDLFGAVLSHAGVHDLLRFQKFTIGYIWCAEYGCSDDGNRTTFDNLYKVSPLHNVRLPEDPNVQYPAMLLTAGDHDDRVVPLHSYKMIAELQYQIGRAAKQTNPLLIKIDTNSGHGAGKPVSKIVGDVAETYAFLVQSAGFVFTP